MNIPMKGNEEEKGGVPLMLKSSDGKPVNNVRIRTEKKFGLKEERAILCVSCRGVVTFPDRMISVDGNHIHTFSNPEGYEYEIGCFSTADGCVIMGDPTMEHTWFNGFSWSFAICSHCQIHLGWFYENGEENFFGLVLDMLIDGSETL